MAGYRLTERARQRLDGIYLASFERFGEGQADSYLGRLHDVMAGLTTHPNKGMSCDDIRPGARRVLVASHAVYYEARGQEIVILDILHKSMLPEDHLPSKG